MKVPYFKEFMYYIKIIFTVESSDELIYSFGIDMLQNELKIIYNNLLGGYTSKGIKTNKKQHEHLKYLLDKRIFKISKQKLDIDRCICIDPYDWNIQCISNDGEPIFEISNEYEKYANPSDSIINLVKYITKIGIESEVLEKMRLL